jgi:hypothetical protein
VRAAEGEPCMSAIVVAPKVRTEDNTVYQHTPEVAQVLATQAKKIAAYMGIEGAEESLLAGSFRSADPLILKFCRDLPSRARILEAGSGTSLPFFTCFDGVPKLNPNFSSPHLARLLSDQGHDVTTVDYKPDSLATDSSQHLATLTSSGLERKTFFCGDLSRIGFNLSNFHSSLSAQSQNGSLIVEKDSPLYAALIKEEWMKEDKQYRFWPCVCSVMEKELFGLRSFGSVDIKDLQGEAAKSSDLFRSLNQKYDLIFLRNSPVVDRLEDLMINDLLPYLRPGGVLLYEVSLSYFARESQNCRHWDEEYRQNLKSSIVDKMALASVEIKDLPDSELVIIKTRADL